MNRIPTIHSPRLATLLALLAATITPIALAPPASAGELTVYSCHAPNGTTVGNDGWTGWSTGQNGIGYQDTCTSSGQGDLHLDVGSYGYPNLARVEWIFLAPAWATIANYTIQVADSYTLPYAGAGEGQAFVHASDESNQVYDYRKLSAGSQGATLIERTPPATATELTLNASCDGEAGACPAGGPISHLDVSSARIVLTDSTLPAVSNIGGPLVAPGALRGSSEITFDAADSGPGIYAAHLIIDGQEQPSVILNTNNGWCENLGQTTDSTRAFAHPTPCLKELSSDLTLDTTQLTDGTHNAKLIVEDASGNSTTGWTGTITTQNAPAETTTPAILAPSQLYTGAELSTQPGSWSAPAGTGSISYAYQWQDCTTAGSECQPIAGATSSTYTPAPSDIAHTLRVQLTATNNDGSATATSAPTGSVLSPSGSLGAPNGPGTGSPGAGGTGTGAGGTMPGGLGAGSPGVLGQPNGSGASEVAQLRLGMHSAISRSFTRRAITVPGRLLNSQGQPITGARVEALQQISGSSRLRAVAHASTRTDGSFNIHVPAGPSRVIEIAYRAYTGEQGYAAQAKVHETVAAGIQLHISTGHTTPTGTILLTGNVLGPIPKQGVIVELTVHYLGEWVPIPARRTNHSGYFHTAYKFLGARGRFPFRAVVRSSQAGFPYSRGYSHPINVTTS